MLTMMMIMMWMLTDCCQQAGKNHDCDNDVDGAANTSTGAANEYRTALGGQKQFIDNVS